jgi:Transcriptional regulators
METSLARDIFRLGRILKCEVEARLKTNIDSTRFLILSYLNNEGNPHIKCQKDIAKFTMLRPSTITISLSKLEKEGLIRRERTANDLREINVYLTEKGFQEVNTIWNTYREIEKKYLAPLTEEEIRCLISSLDKISGLLTRE